MPSDFVNGMRAVAGGLRALAGPAAFDIRPTTITIQVRTYASGFRSVAGGYTLASSLALDPSIRVRHVSTREIADSGGRYSEDDVKVGPITPPYTDPSSGVSGGYSAAQIDPAPSVAQNATTHQGTDVVYVLKTENASDVGIAGEYSLHEMHVDRQFKIVAVLRRRKTTP